MTQPTHLSRRDFLAASAALAAAGAVPGLAWARCPAWPGRRPRRPRLSGWGRLTPSLASAGRMAPPCWRPSRSPLRK
ncbi:twin-arginine translocation signal domain-containing protein [Achromobacter sp.]|uniref:twin-arginine translocation signal domain-containing protein n=1 Tax=Achromobacter sp. TaxID=134375 RepID=UPI0028A691C8|nr:twin-arginine translocation signal domain-containing protein [Achromobacter sp.]